MFVAYACAIIVNTTNVAMWRFHHGRLHTASYIDSGDSLIYSRPVPRIVKMAEGALAVAPIGQHRIKICLYRR